MTARFIGEVRTQWLKHSGDDRKMELIEEFRFIDKRGFEWVAPLGSVIDGASIPSMLWSSQGAPFVGDYRRASVIHDVYCQTKSEPHTKVHEMFYEAMRADGMGKFQAKKMYTAFRLFGPKWDLADEAGLQPLADLEIPFDELNSVLNQLLGE